MNVLIVDDSKIWIIQLERALNGQNYNILTASTGREALEMVADEEVSVILLDINMPVMDGRVFMNELQQQSRLKPIPIIIVSANVNKKVSAEMLEAGAFDVLAKPVDEKELQEKISRALGVEA